MRLVFAWHILKHRRWTPTRINRRPFTLKSETLVQGTKQSTTRMSQTTTETLACERWLLIEALIGSCLLQLSRKREAIDEQADKLCNLLESLDNLVHQRFERVAADLDHGLQTASLQVASLRHRMTKPYSLAETSLSSKMTHLNKTIKTRHAFTPKSAKGNLAIPLNKAKPLFNIDAIDLSSARVIPASAIQFQVPDCISDILRVIEGSTNSMMYNTLTNFAYAFQPLYPIQRDIPLVAMKEQRIGISIPPSGIRAPHGIAVHPSDGRIFVLGYEQCMCYVFSKEGKLVHEFNGSSASTPAFRGPHGIAISACGKFVVIADSLNNRVVILTSEGVYVNSFGGMGSGLKQFRMPQFVTFDVENNFYVSDFENHRIHKYTIKGEFVKFIGDPKSSHPAGGVDGICVDDNGRLLSLQQGGSFVRAYTLDGDFICDMNIDRVNCWNYVSRGPDNGFLICDCGTATVSFYSPVGERKGETKVYGCRAAVFDTQGRLLVSSNRQCVIAY